MNQKSRTKTQILLDGYISYVLGALWLVLGLIFAIWPSVTSHVLWFIVAMLLFVSGTITFFMGLNRMAKQSAYPYSIELSAVLIAIGGWIFMDRNTFLTLIPILCGVLLFIHGLVDALKAWKLSLRRQAYWWSALVVGGILLILGMVLFFNPFKEAVSLLRYIGISLIFNGLADLWLSFCLSRAGKHSLLEENIEPAEPENPRRKNRSSNVHASDDIEDGSDALTRLRRGTKKEQES